jgi:(hydroxyamino)benzene mutase
VHRPLASLDRTLLTAGAILFLLGLVQGTATHFFASPRLALSAHIAGVQNGLVLLVIGLVWPRIKLSSKTLLLTMVAMIVGMYAIWLSFTVAAVIGAGSVFRFAGAGLKATSRGDLLVTALVYLGSATAIVAALLVALGLIKR